MGSLHVDSPFIDTPIEDTINIWTNPLSENAEVFYKELDWIYPLDCQIRKEKKSQ